MASPDPQPVTESSPAEDQGTPVHVYTYLLNAGLSPADVTTAGDELWRLIRARLGMIATSDDPQKRLRYAERTPRGAAYRKKINREVIAEAFLAMKFSRGELVRIDEGLNLGLTTAAVKTGKVFARVTGIDGETREYQVLTEHVGTGFERTFLKDIQTSRVIPMTV